MVVDALEVGVSFILDLLGELLAAMGEDTGGVACLTGGRRQGQALCGEQQFGYSALHIDT